MAKWWKTGDRALLYVPHARPGYASSWDDWWEIIQQAKDKEVKLGSPHYDEGGKYGFFVSWGDQAENSVWAPEAWLVTPPWAGGTYLNCCGGLNTHRLMCPTQRQHDPDA